VAALYFCDKRKRPDAATSGLYDSRIGKRQAGVIEKSQAEKQKALSQAQEAPRWGHQETVQAFQSTSGRDPELVRKQRAP
jgi:hypothetical protein